MNRVASARSRGKDEPLPMVMELAPAFWKSKTKSEGFLRREKRSIAVGAFSSAAIIAALSARGLV